MEFLTAKALYLGGKWLSKHDPVAADRFYKALVRRNPNLLIAQQADKLRWFPAEFTDAVVYKSMAGNAKWYGSKRRAAVTLAVVLCVFVVAGGVSWRWRRSRKLSA